MEEMVNKRDLKENKATIDVVDKQNIKDTRNNNNNEIDYDELLSSAGEIGRYQILLFFSTFPFYVYGVFVYYSQLFMTEVSPNHWCWIPELANLSDIERRSLAIPQDEDARFGYSQCTAYVANWTEVLLMDQKPDETWSTQPCQYGWEFNKTEIPYPTISSDLNWVCDKKSYQASAQAFFFLGSAAGGLVIGWIADRFGRLPAAVISNIVGCISGIITIFARNFIEFSICRFFIGFAYDNCMMMTYLLVLEYVAPKYRTLVANMGFALFYSVAVTSLPWIALACSHWKTFGLATSLPLALAILAPLFIPESPRWLLSKGRVDEAIEKVTTIGRINKKEVPSKIIQQFKLSLSNKKNEESKSTLELLKRPLLRRMFLCVCFEYMFCTIVFDALVRSIGQLDFDFFISFSVISATEFPSQILIVFIMDWMGRRWLTTIVMTISCLFSILTVFVGGGLPAVFCAVIARFAVNMAYGAVMQWAAEMLPTTVRGSGASIVHITGYVATIVSPYIVYLERYVLWLPLVLVGCMAGLGAITALALPETANKDMPQTFDEAEELVRTQKLWDFPCIGKKYEKSELQNNGFGV